MSDTKRLQFFKLVNGVRMPYYMVVDRTLLVLEEGLLAAPAGPVPIGTTPDPQDNKVAEWVVPDIPNPYPGTDELRAQYFEEEAALKKSHEDAGTECPGCQLGALLRKYRTMLEERGFAK